MIGFIGVGQSWELKTRAELDLFIVLIERLMMIVFCVSLLRRRRIRRENG